MAKTGPMLAEFKSDPVGTVRKGGGKTVTVLNGNEPAFYGVPPVHYEAMLELIVDLELLEVVRARRGGLTVQIDIDELIVKATAVGAG